jgi:hypothetical protein
MHLEVSWFASLGWIDVKCSCFESHFALVKIESSRIRS